MTGGLSLGALVIAGLLTLAGAGPSTAEISRLAQASPAAGQAPPAQPVERAPAPAHPQVVMPDQNKILLLVRTTLLTLNDALHTGNYTVLRDVAAPAFREANSAARLAQIFGPLAQRGVDLTPVAVLTPQLANAPTLDPKTGMLHIKGSFPGQPVQLNFEVLYQPVGGRWRLFGLAVNPATAGPTASAEGAGKHAAPKILTKEPEKKAEPKKK
ncbi:MAG TPA: hypothetical protein VNK52_12180 [Hyphomicrobiaceae bacterium]|nr:hypothetical protein [Hyphomicrobiaceae bacterium]